MDVWVVFQNVNEDPLTPPILIEFQGVFDSREAALAACRTDRYVMGRCRLNDSAPHESSADWLKDACYPIQHEASDD
jgi:hypothetical protein